MKYPTGYEWLATLGTLPKTVTEGLKEFGTIETPGPGNNSKIMSWAKELKISSTYSADSVPWCGLFQGIASTRAGKSMPKNPLWALNWAKEGKAIGQPGLGDILVFLRDGGGHVGQYIAEDTIAYHVLGGNQGDKVCIERVLKKRLFAARRPNMVWTAPKSARPYIVNTSGRISTNEA